MCDCNYESEETPLSVGISLWYNNYSNCVRTEVYRLAALQPNSSFCCVGVVKIWSDVHVYK